MSRRAPVELPLPDVAYLTPSNINPWRGGRTPGARWTNSQLVALRVAGMDPESCDGVQVRSVSSPREHWAGEGNPQPVYVFECPVISRRQDGRVLVISPAGMRKLVYTDGSITRRRLS